MSNLYVMPFRIVVNHYRAVVDFFCKIALVLSCDVAAPIWLKLKLSAVSSCLFQVFNSLSIADSCELSFSNLLKTFDKSWLDSLVEEFEVTAALC